MKKSPLKRSQIPLKKTPLRTKINGKEKQEERKKLHEEDQRFYEKIWKDRQGKSDLTGNYLGNEMMIIFFHHLLPKKSYPQFRHKKWNILLCESKYHSQIELSEHGLPEDIYDRFKQIEKRAKEKAGI